MTVKEFIKCYTTIQTRDPEDMMEPVPISYGVIMVDKNGKVEFARTYQVGNKLSTALGNMVVSRFWFDDNRMLTIECHAG